MMKWFAKIFISLALIAVLLWKTNVALLTHHILSISPTMVVASALLMLSVAGIRAYRWSAMMSAYNVQMDFRKSLELIQVGNFFGQFLPTTIGGDMVRTWQAHRDGLPLRVAIHTVLLDRWFGFVSLLFILLASIPALSRFFLKPEALWVLVTLAFFALIALMIMLVLDRMILGWRDIKILTEVSAFSKSARQFSANASLSLPVLIACVVTHLISIAAIKVLADGVGANVSFYQMLILMPPVLFLTMLPFSLAGWGIREGSMIFMLAYAGVSQEQAFSISILFGLVSLLVSFHGGIIMLYAPAKWGGKFNFNE